MSEMPSVWVDVERCTGCAACADVCQDGAISVIDGTAEVNEATCTGCLDCADACPEGAIQPVVEGELVAADSRPAPAVREAQPLVRRAAPVIAVAGASVLAHLARGLVELIGDWLTTDKAAGQIERAAPAPRAGGGRANGGGPRARHRRRGR